MTSVYDEVGRRSIYQNVELFIRSKSNIQNVAIFKYSWHKFGETILPKKTINLSHENSDHFWQYVTRVFDDAEKWSIYQSVQYFIWSNSDVMNFVTVKYSLQQSDKTVLHWNDDTPVIHRSHVTTISSVIQRIGFDHSGVIHISERSVLYLE